MNIIDKLDKVAICHGNDSITYIKLLENIAYYTSLFQVKRGDRVAIFSENRLEWIYAFYSAWQQNAIPVPLDALASTKDVAYMLTDASPKVVFCSKEKLPLLQEVLANLAHKPTVAVFESIDPLQKSNISVSSMKVEYPQDTAVIIYTSGTTGSPKGVMLSYENLWINIRGVSNDVVIFTPQDRVLILLPIHHIFSLMGSIIIPLTVGAEIVFAKSILGKEIIETLQKHKITIVIGVPRLYEELRKNILLKIKTSKIAWMLFMLAAKMKSRGLSQKIFKAVHNTFGGHIKHLVAGGAALNPEVARDFLTLGFDILEGYGMTEAAPMITFTRPWKQRIGSAGMLLPSVEVKFEEGEILAKGKSIMKGYYKRPEETNEVLKDGWLHTGDLGYIDKDGYLFVTGRKKEIIVLSNGKNINPNEVESELMNTNPIIKEVGVFADNDSLHAIIIVEEKLINHSLPLEQQLRDLVLIPYNNSVSPYKKVVKMTITKDELPKTRLGKIKRFMLADFITIPSDNKIQEEDNNPCYSLSEFRVIGDYLMKEKNILIHPSSNLEYDLNLDSLDKVALESFINSTFGISISTEKYKEFNTIENLCYFISENKTKEEVEDIDWGTIIRESLKIRLPQNWLGLNLFSKVFTSIGKLIFGIKGGGINNIPNVPCIIAPNHQSFLDGLFVSGLMRFGQLKNTYFYAKEKHLQGWFLRFFANTNNIIIVDINKDLKTSIQKLAEALKQQKSIIIFPEGTRSISGSLGDFKKMFAILSLELNVPIVPVSINGSNRSFHQVDVTFHKAVYPEKNDTYDSLTQKVKNIIQKSLRID